MYDTIIIGAGPAGLSAAIYAARAKLNFLIISKETGGLITWAPKVDNYPGIFNISGQELIDRMLGHLDWYKIEVKDYQVKTIKPAGDNYSVETDKGNFETKTVIICTGSSPRKLKVLGADRFEGKGISYCAACDAPLYAGKIVAVIGGGDSAMATALSLSNVAKRTYLMHDKFGLTGGDKNLRNAVMNNEKIKIINNVDIREIIGERTVKGIKFREAVESKSLDLDGIFVSIGQVRNTEFLKGLVKLNANKEIIVDSALASSMPGVFAAGDVNNNPGKQAIISAGEGARALLSAVNYIQRGGSSK